MSSCASASGRWPPADAPYNRPMRILAIDMGTGTQDILLYDSARPVENSVKMVLPSATEIAARRIRRATAAGRPILLTGVVAGGGPCGWALEDHLRAGAGAFATAEAAQTFDDDLDRVRAMGVELVSEDEARRIDGEQVVLQDLDLAAVRTALAAFEEPTDFDGLALGCLDHGAAPPGVSDRLFRFEHLRRIVESRNDLLAFASRGDALPAYLTRARAMAASAAGEWPVVFMDTGPAAALGALHDEHVAEVPEQLVLNLGNMHLLGFHLRGRRVASLFEHHTGELAAGRIVIDPLDERMVQPSSVDLRLGRFFRVFLNHTTRVIDVKENQEDLTPLVEIKEEDVFVLHPGEFVLGSTAERVQLPNDLVARLEGKSSLGRLGLLIHSTAGFVDAGWNGHLTLELSNVANLPITLYPGMKIGQISFLRMTTPADVPYGSKAVGSKYQGQQGPTPSRYYENFRED